MDQTSPTTAPLQTAFAEPPPPGEIREVAPGVGWLRMPLPFALNHINLWVLRDDQGLTLVDCGINTDATRALWQTLFDGPLAGLPVRQLICTHFHPDHIGLAGWLADRCRVKLSITPLEWAAARRAREADPEDERRALTAVCDRAGLSDIRAGEAPSRNSYASGVAPLPQDAVMLDAAATVFAANTTWRIVIGRGHAPELAALYAPALKVLISGDQVLPGISPNVSVHPYARDDNPLRAFIDSLADFRALPEDTLVLPSHKLPFTGLQRRVDELIAHHHDRLEDARRACAEGATAAFVMTKLFPRKLDGHQTIFALGETLAHLNFLIARGEIRREHGADGRDSYRTVAAAA